MAVFSSLLYHVIDVAEPVDCNVYGDIEFDLGHAPDPDWKYK